MSVILSLIITFRSVQRIQRVSGYTSLGSIGGMLLFNQFSRKEIKMRKLLLSLVAIVFAAGLHAKEVTLLMDWFPQGNQSGFWQAQFDNKYHDDVKIKIKSGGPKVNTTSAVASGQVEFGLQASDSVMLANAKGAGLKGYLCES